MKTIFVSQDKESTKILSRMLNVIFNQEIELVTSTTLQDAVKSAVEKGPYQLIFMDMDLKDYDPNEIVEELIDVNGVCPVIFTGSQTMIKDRLNQEVLESNSLNDKIPKPIDKDKVLNIVKPIIDEIRPKNQLEGVLEIDSSEFIKMKIKYFYLYDVFGYDLFSEITPTKYMRVIEANIPYSHSYLQKFIKGAMKFFYIHKNDYLKYLEEESQKCINVIGKINGNHKDVFLILIRSVSILHENLREVGVTETVLTLADATTNIILDTCDRRKYFNNIIEFYPVKYASISSKSILCAFISIFYCEELTWQAISTKRNLVLASILMDFDVEEEEMCFSVYMDDIFLDKYGDEQILKYKGHPIIAAKIGSQFSQYPEVDYIIKNHHELPNKKGFPKAPSPSTLTPLCAVIGMSHYVAIRIDGHKITNKIVGDIIANMSQFFSVAQYKPVFNLTAKALRLKK